MRAEKWLLHSWTVTISVPGFCTYWRAFVPDTSQPRRVFPVLHDQYLAPTNQVCTVSASRINVLTASQELGWVYKYSEKKAVKSGNPWRIRHTGIYHVHDRERSKTTLIILNPSPAAHFALHLRNILQQAQARAMIVASPMLIHAMLISSHLSSWREYLEHHETLLLDLVKFSPRELVEECITN
jgi:heme/copper-type cytochrome/quinol oxidase subunit 1